MISVWCSWHQFNAAYIIRRFWNRIPLRPCLARINLAVNQGTDGRFQGRKTAELFTHGWDFVDAIDRAGATRSPTINDILAENRQFD